MGQMESANRGGSLPSNFLFYSFPLLIFFDSTSSIPGSWNGDFLKDRLGSTSIDFDGMRPLSVNSRLE